MALVLEIEHLSGVCFAALGPDSDTPDWPIQPDRAFSALVAAWSSRGEDPTERSALTWLEKQAPPEIEATAAEARTCPTVFVPPNDVKTRLGRNLGAMLGVHGRQSRRFPAVAALEPEFGLVTRLVWSSVDADDAPIAALDAVARDAAYVGHSTSLTRCRFFVGKTRGHGVRARRPIYSGRFGELERDFARGVRPSPAESIPIPENARDIPSSMFGPDWIVLEIVAGNGHKLRRPDVRAAPKLARTLRETIMSGYGACDLEAPLFVSGHEADGEPTRLPHLAIVPLADVGFEYSDASLFGFALVPPTGLKLLDDMDFRRALGAKFLLDPSTRTRRLKLYKRGENDCWLRFGGEGSNLKSLDSSRYSAISRTWATATPMVLERHLKASSPDDRVAEAESLVARACENIGLPTPVSIERTGRQAVLVDKHSAILAAPPVYPSGKAPNWMRWGIPERFASRPLAHAVVTFPEPVRGPVILGAGRFVGLGLCLPLGRERNT